MPRPKARISAAQVSKLAALGCSQDDIAEVFGVDQSTISKRFASEFARARGRWKTSLRRAQTIRAVKDRSDAMLIHLGKVYLGQAGGGDGGALAEILAGLVGGRGDPGRPGDVPR